MTYLSLCSGIEATTLAWAPLGLRPIAFAEVDKFCSALLRHYYPAVPNLGDIRSISGQEVARTYGKPDIIVAGTPCQAFSISGPRAGLSDPRGQVTAEFVRVVSEALPAWVLWENVPGVLSLDSGRTFRWLLSSLDELGYGLAWRVLDAQYFGVPQRRRRVFLIGYLGDYLPPVAVLFEPEGVPGPTALEAVRPEVPVGGPARLCFEVRRSGSVIPARLVPTMSGKNMLNFVVLEPGGPSGYRPRRITPLEMERAQGLPDGYTDVPGYSRRGPVPDSVRYRAIQNSMPVPVMSWLGRRILSSARACENIHRQGPCST